MKLKEGLSPKKIINYEIKESELFSQIRGASDFAYKSLDTDNGGLKSNQKFHLPSLIDFFKKVVIIQRKIFRIYRLNIKKYSIWRY